MSTRREDGIDERIARIGGETEGNARTRYPAVDHAQLFKAGVSVG